MTNGTSTHIGRHRLAAARWRRVSMLAPACIGAILVAVLAWQAAREASAHRTLVQRTLRDYAAFAAWQYARRATDYLRLAIGESVIDAQIVQASRPARLDDPCEAAPISPACHSPFHFAKLFAGQATADSAIWQNDTQLDSRELTSVLEQAGARSGQPPAMQGIAEVRHADSSLLVAYRVRPDAGGQGFRLAGGVVTDAELAAVLEHVVHFAPLLPPTLTGSTRSDSLLSLRVTTAEGREIARFGRDVPGGTTASDSLWPVLAGMRVVVTLRPDVADHLVAGGLPQSRVAVLIAMLLVTLALLLVAVLQVRRWDELVRAREDFVTGVSHELRTPLTQISLFTETMLTGEDWPLAERRHFLVIIQREATRLRQLVDGVLRFAAIGRTTTPQLEASLLAHEIGLAVEAFQPIADARNVTLVVDADSTLEAALDRDGFRQLLLNLLDNAVKFGPDGQQIAVTLLRRGALATLSVADHGPGIPVEERDRVFRPFVRSAATSTASGNGIGLAVVRDVVATLGGTVTIATTAGGGTTVIVELPLLVATVSA